eukprot:6959989-Prymnesium_polylepis.1
MASQRHSCQPLYEPPVKANTTSPEVPDGNATPPLVSDGAGSKAMAAARPSQSTAMLRRLAERDKFEKLCKKSRGTQVQVHDTPRGNMIVAHRETRIQGTTPPSLAMHTNWIA